MSRAALILIGSALGVGAAIWISRQGQAQSDSSALGAAVDALSAASDAIQTGVSQIMPFTLAKNLPKNAPYVALLEAAETRYGIPPGALVAQAWQESRFNPAAVSPVGAQGIMQFMPATAAQWNVQPFDPASAIDGAGRYMAWLYKQVGDWKLAFAAYNWGIGNVKNKGLAAAPAETQNYVAAIGSNSGAFA